MVFQQKGTETPPILDFYFHYHAFCLNIDILGVIQYMKFYLRVASQLTVQKEQTGQNRVIPGEHRHKCYPNSQAAF